MLATKETQGTLTSNDSIDDDVAVQLVNPSWFESPVKPMSKSGGTAAIFKLTLTDEGLEECRKRNGGAKIDKNYWIGKDLSRASDEKEFYLKILRVRTRNDPKGRSSKILNEGIVLLESFMFDYLGVLRTKTPENQDTDKYCELLVMANMRNHYNDFRMLDLKIGEKTAVAGWKGKSRLRAMKHHLMDGFSASATEGYRIAGFDGCPKVFDSMDPLIDILADEHVIGGEEVKSGRSGSMKTMLGGRINEAQAKNIQRISFIGFDGTSILRYFYDLRQCENSSNPTATDNYTPIEVAEIVSLELLSQLIRLSALCNKVKIPQKWIGSSIALYYDSGFFPDRSSEIDIRSKVNCRLLDWGRSELLTAEDYENLTIEEKKDRARYWDLYKKGVDRLSFNATRFYYNMFTSTPWVNVTIRIMDFDSMSPDDWIGQVVIPLPDPSNTEAVKKLGESKAYALSQGMFASMRGSTIHCSITWVDFPRNSRLQGAWRVTIERANSLPSLDTNGTSDPYCIVMANKSTDGRGRQFYQKTCVIARNLNPKWNETIDIPVCRITDDSSLKEVFLENGISDIKEKKMSEHFQWDKKTLLANFQWDKNRAMKWWKQKVEDAEIYLN